MHRFLKVSPVVLLFVFLFIPSAEARADTVEITGGTLGIGNTSTTVPVYGTFSFNLTGNNFQAVAGSTDVGHVGIGKNCSSPCLAGSTLSLSSTNNYPSDGARGILTLDSQSHVGFLGATLTLSTGTLTIPLDAPTDPNLSFTLTTNFTMTGTIDFTGWDTQNQVFTGFNYSSPVFGSGLVDITLALNRFTHEYEVKNVTYRFQPSGVPEPATLVLFGTGLAGVAGAYRRRRRLS
jgi:PEP-CTERM motif